MVPLGFLLLLVLLCLLFEPSLSDYGTTPNIEDILKGRCYEKAGLDPFLRTLQFDCEAIYTQFTSAYLGKDPTTITSMAPFLPFLAATRHPIPVNQSLFWTGSSSFTYNPIPGHKPLTRDIVHGYSGRGLRFWTLEDSMWGNMANGLNFCGANLESQTNNNSIFNFSSCPPFASNGSSFYFWIAASAQFAQLASGAVSMLGYPNGRRIYRTGNDPNYPNETASIFSSIEIKNLNASQITSFTSLIIPNDKFPTERCGQGSLVQMAKDLTAIAKIPADRIFCIDDPDDVRHLICIDEYDTPECAFYNDVIAAQSSSSSGVSGLTSGQVWAIAIPVGFLAGMLFLVIVQQVCCKSSRSDDGYMRVDTA